MQMEELKEHQDIASWGVSTCQGCGLENAFRTVVNVLGPKTIVLIPPGCSTIFSGVGS